MDKKNKGSCYFGMAIIYQLCQLSACNRPNDKQVYRDRLELHCLDMLRIRCAILVFLPLCLSVSVSV